MICSLLKSRLPFPFTKRLVYPLITHKLYYGQGGQLQFDLVRRNYKIQLQTFWEDHCELQINGLKGVKNFTVYEEENKAFFKDQDLEDRPDEQIEVKLRIPEDYTLGGRIKGSLNHIDGQVGRKLRSKPFSFSILGQNNTLSLGDVKTESIKIDNEQGEVVLSGLTVQEGTIKASKIQSKKLMTSHQLHLNAHQMIIRSLLMFGPSKGYLKGGSLKFQSISGYSVIEGEKVGIDRYYAGAGCVNIKCKQVEGKISVETGTGSIEFENEEQLQSNKEKVVLGRMHKGGLKVSGSTIQIQ